MTTPRTALITGAGSATGIGFATAARLAEKGYRVVLTSHSDRALVRAQELVDLGFPASAVIGDLTDKATPLAIAEWVESNVGYLDAVVVNHGMTSVLSPMDTTAESGSIDDTALDRFELSLSRNLTSSYALIRAALPMLRRSLAGRIVAVSSITGGTMAMRHEVSYAASKAGLEGLVRALAVDEAEHGITVNAVAPGWIATASQTPDEAEQGVLTPMGRSGRPDEIAAVITFLASLEASYLTGQVVVVDGGNSIAEERFSP